MTDPAPITSSQNPRLKAAAKLRDRRDREAAGLFLIDGMREIRRAAAAGWRIRQIFVSTGSPPLPAELQTALVRQQAEVFAVAERAFAKLAFGERMEGAVAVAEMRRTELGALRLNESALVLVLERLEKPGNLGAVLRTADAVGAAAVIVAEPRADLFNPNVVRASVGTLFTAPTAAASGDDVRSWLSREKFHVFAARVDGAKLYTDCDFRGRTALVLGSEADGLSDAWRTPDVTAIRLPMLGRADSLNVSVTAAVLAYEALRQRAANALPPSSAGEATA